MSMPTCANAPASPAIADLLARNPLLAQVARAEEACWVNPRKVARAAEGLAAAPLIAADIDDAAARLDRFAPLIAQRFPETTPRGGLIESPLTPIPAMRDRLNERHGAGISGQLLLKRDSDLAIAGSVKARGGIYEVLAHAEGIAFEHGLLAGPEDAYEKLLAPEARAVFAGQTVQVGSTGNLGMSIGIMAAALGFHAVVHMSADARQWKKDLLRSRGVEVVEYAGDYGAAVQQGRARSDADPTSYFVDDENSQALFLGYAVAARRLAAQLDELGIPVDAKHPLFTYVPCGVGGAPGGVSFGLKHVFGDAVHCFFVEPTQAPCMLLGMASGLHSGICAQDVGLSGATEADGLAVGRPSGFVGSVMEPLLSGIFTVRDELLFDYLRDLALSECLFIEPSACAAFAGPARVSAAPETQAYLAACDLTAERMARATHVAWATGGALVPQPEREKYLRTGA